MAHTAAWPSKIFFYPIGNTPAVCFTSDLPPEQPANVLLLGCGDVRNVLYTVYADLGAPTRNLDFTCCDLEPAVLARNVLLYTLVADFPEQNVEEHISRMWNLYYHFFIDQSTLDVLLKQCQRLVDVSTDLPVWNSSKYGSFIRFCDAHTLSSIRRHWMLYIETDNFSKNEKDSLRKRFRRDSREEAKHLNFGLTCSAGPLWMELPKDLAMKHFHHYWGTGVVVEDAEDAAAAKLINPTFAYSMMGLGFELHYASDPLLSFHLAEALAPVKGTNPKKSVISTSLIKSAMSQFRGWCQALSTRLRSVNSTFVVRFFVGDVLAFCRALHYCAITDDGNTGLYASSWSSVLIDLERGDYTGTSSFRAPLQFNVIDTSNLTDHVGLLNILPVCKPLMQRSPSSVLHTNSLHHLNESGSDFLKGLCGDVSILSIILDLIPISYASNFTTNSNMHEFASGMQTHERLSWRIGAISDSQIVQIAPVNRQRLNFDEKQLATFFYGVYLKMFSDENPLLAFSTSEKKQPSPFNYVRFSFAYLLRVVKDQVHLDWESLVDHLHDMISFDRNLVTGPNNIQDLFCAFHMLGVYSFQPFIAGFNDSLTKEKVFHGWKDIPTVVSITFQVPRRKFECLENAGWLGTPILFCALTSNTKHNAFQNYQSFFGCIRADYRANPPSITIDEDIKGLQGSSPVVFTFYVPTWVLGVESLSLKVTIAVRPSPFVVGKLLPILGIKLEIFSANITDRNYVHVTRERPGNLGEVQKIRKTSFTQRPQPISSIASLGSDAIKLHLDSDGKKLVTLTNRATVVDAAAKVALTNNATVSVHQISSHAMRVTFGKHRYVIPYPFPVDSTNSKTRIARKSHYVEVELRISNPTQKFGMSLNPFPIIKHTGLLHLWNIHYIHLDQLPTLDLSREKRLDFVPPHVGMAYSDRERRLRETSMRGRLEESNADAMTNVKETIHTLFVTICKQKSRVFGLADPDNGGTYTLIFVNDMRLDLAANAVVVDAVVLPLTENIVEDLHIHIGNLHAAGIVTIKTFQDEVRVWKHLLPAFTERCRKWKHTLNCKYLTKGVPVSEEMEQSPLCECGSGKDLGPFIKNKEWKVFAPHSTRIAISPLFAVPFIDTIGKSWLEDAKEKADVNACAKCDGPGKPKLLLCGACQKTKYCSAECQKEDWKSHKKQCKKS